MKSEHRNSNRFDFVASLQEKYRPVLAKELRIVSENKLNTEEIDELIDITLLSFLKSFMEQKFEYQGDSQFDSYLKTIARYNLYQYYGDRKDYEAAEKAYLQEMQQIDVPQNIDWKSPLRDPFNPDWIRMSRQDTTRFLHLCFNELSEEDQEVLTLFYYEEKRVREIAELMNRSESWVKIRLFRSRNSLEDCIKKRRDKN